MTDHTLTVTAVDDTTFLSARCACAHWSMVVPDAAIALKLHRCHIADCTNQPHTEAPDVHVRRSRGRHGANHPASTWWRRHHTG